MSSDLYFNMWYDMYYNKDPNGITGMDRIIGVTELQRRFRSVFDEVVQKHIPYILTRGSRPEAVLISYDLYVRLMRADEAGVLKRFDALLDRMARVNAQYSEEEVEADLREATKMVRSQKRT